MEFKLYFNELKLRKRWENPSSEKLRIEGVLLEHWTPVLRYN